MAANKLTPEQDITLRKFFKAVADDDTFMSAQSRSYIMRAILKELNYQWLPNGAFITSGTPISVKFGTTNTDAYECEWAADEERAIEAITLKDTPESSASSESADTEVREAVLPEDVQ